MLKQLEKRMQEQDIKLEIDESVKELIAKKGVDTNYGARPLKRAIQNVLEDKIAEEILDGKIKPNKKAKIFSKEEELVVEQLQFTAKNLNNNIIANLYHNICPF